MKIKMLQDEDFVNYKKPSMFIGLGHCNWKCCVESGISSDVCQNSELAKQPDIEVSCQELYERYAQNPITSAIVIGGLEPFTHSSDVIHFIDYVREQGNEDDIVIYTGFYPNEIPYIGTYFKEHYKNIIIKYGRFIPNKPKRFDKVLGIELISNNQYAVQL